MSNPLQTGSKYIIKKSFKKIGTNINYIMSYKACEYKHNAIKLLISDQNINVEVFDSPTYMDALTTKFRTFLT